MIVYTKQNRAILSEISERGRYLAKRRYVQNDLQDQAEIMAIVYDELVANHPRVFDKPSAAEVPVWVAFSRESTMQPESGFAILTLDVPDDEVTRVNIAKWGHMLNYGYLAADSQDLKRHKDLMSAYGVDDATAVMTQFYPELKREIIASWSRLFDDSVSLGSDASYGLLWEIRQEWIEEIE